jgi:hypothetical protein
VIHDLYPGGWQEHPPYSAGRGVSLRTEQGEQLAYISLGITARGVSADVCLDRDSMSYVRGMAPLSPEEAMSLSRRVADAMAATALAVVTAYRAGEVAEAEQDLPIPYRLASPEAAQ